MHVGNKDLRQRDRNVLKNVCRIMGSQWRWRVGGRSERVHIMCTSCVQKKDNFNLLLEKSILTSLQLQRRQRSTSNSSTTNHVVFTTTVLHLFSSSQPHLPITIGKRLDTAFTDRRLYNKIQQVRIPDTSTSAQPARIDRTMVEYCLLVVLTKLCACVSSVSWRR